MTEFEAYVAFNLTERIGSVKLSTLALQSGGVVAAWEAYKDKTARSGGEVDVAAELKLAKKYGVAILTPVDEAYPKSLLELPSHPLALYVKGDVKALSKPSISIVGTRRATEYGLEQARTIAGDLARSGWSVVSGLALGIDAAAHKGALSAGGTTVGIIGSGLDRFYPEENRELARDIVQNGGAVASEFPFGRPPDQHTFPQRNHIIAAISKGILAIEAPVKSGTLITTSFASEIGRTVMALPGRVDSHASQGCLSLLRGGATLVRSAKDVNAEFQELFDAKRPAGGAENGKTGKQEKAPSSMLDIEESLVLKCVGAEAVSMEDLVAKTRLPAAKVNALAMMLRLKGLVRFLPGNRISRPREP